VQALVRAHGAMLEVAVTSSTKPFETRIADLVRRLGTDHEGEAVATGRALKRLLATRDVSFTDLGDGIEKLATGGLEEAEMKRVFDAGYQKGVEDTERKRMTEEAVLGRRFDGSTDGKRLRSTASARKTASKPRAANSSTTWRRA
jgi:hypothetical protein